jgi:hypothetical protein
MDLEIESNETLNGYFFEINEQVGRISASGYECIVTGFDEGYLFDRLGWGDSRDSLSIYGFLTKDDDLDSCNADFYLKIPSLANPSAKVCAIDVKNRKTGYNILAIDTIYVSDFNHADSFEVFPLRFLQKEWIEEDTQYTYIYLSTGLYWFDEVDLEVDKIRVYNPKGKNFFEDIPRDTIYDSLSNYFANLEPHQSAVHSYYLADEPRGGSIPTIHYSDVLLKNNSSPDVRALTAMSAYNWSRYPLTEVYAKIVQPPAVLADYYWYRCGMSLATDTCMTCWRYQCGDPCWNIQYPINRFARALDSMYQKSNRQNREFWSVLGSARFDRCPEGSDFCFWDLEDPNEEVFKVSIYLSLAHGAKGLGFWTYGSYGFPTDTGQRTYEPEAYDPEIAEENIRDTCPCDIPEECIHYDDNQPTVGLYDWDPVNQIYTRNNKWFTLKNILDRAKGMGTLLRQFELIDVGLIDSGAVGIVDHIVGIYDPNWIEAATFDDGNEILFMLVNRRLLPHETNSIRVYLDRSQIPSNRKLVDVSTLDEYTIYSNPPYFETELLPGEGKLFRFIPPDILAGSFYELQLSDRDTIIGDIRITEGGRLTIDSDSRIYIAPFDTMYSGQDYKKIEIIVDGDLRIHGTENDPIEFQPQMPYEFGNSSWYGIRSSGHGIAEIRYARIPYAYKGIELANDDSSSVTNCQIDSCELYGISIDNPQANIEDNTITVAENIGVYIGESAKISSNDIILCDYNTTGIKVDNAAPEIFYNNIYSYYNDDPYHLTTHGTGLILNGATSGEIAKIWENDIIDCSNGVKITGKGIKANFNCNSIKGHSGCMWPLKEWARSDGLGVYDYNSMNVSHFRENEISNFKVCVASRNSAVNLGDADSIGNNFIFCDSLDCDTAWCDEDSLRCDSLNANYRLVINWGGGTISAIGNNWGESQTVDSIDDFRFEGSIDYAGWIFTMAQCLSSPPPGDPPGQGDPGQKLITNESGLKYEIDQNFPNPFNPFTQIKYSLAKETHVRIKIYNILGQNIATIVDELQRPGEHIIYWDGKNDNGDEVASGLYLYMIDAGDYKKSKKMMLLK